MSEIFFSPKINGTPIILTVVKVDQGLITYEDWIKALSKRINSFLSIESNPKKAARKACEKLLLPICDDLHNFGDHLTANNPRFREYFSLDSFDDGAFPYFVNNQASNNEMYYKCSLEAWVNMLDFVLSGAIESGLSLIGSYTDREISEPDEQIKPYVNFIHKSTLDAHCDFECTDSDSCEVHAYLYQFGYFLSHDDSRVRLSLVVLPNKNTRFQSLEFINQFVDQFNENHETKISFRFEMQKKLLVKNIYIPKHYMLNLEMPISSDAKLIAKIFNIFYSDIFDFYKNQTFDEITPKANFKEEGGDSFLNYLQDEIMILKLIESGKINRLLS